MCLGNATSGDDGRPELPGVLTFEWTVLQGEDGGSVTFSDTEGSYSGVLNPVASFSRSGDYTLQLRAFDGEYWSPADTAAIDINEPDGYLLTVFAGQDKKITQPGRVELYDAEVCADGNCRPPDDVNTVWYKVDGPGTVDFGDKNVVKTWARFSEAGIYTLGLETAATKNGASD